MRRTELKCRIHINLGDSTLDDAKDVLSSHILPSARRTLHWSSTRPALALALPSVFFRSFQRALYLIPHTLLTLLSGASAALCVSLRDLVLATQSASEARHAFEPAFPPFPHAALWKLLATFPPPVLGKLLAWMMLSEQLEETRLGPLAAPLAMENLVNVKEDTVGLLGYTMRFIASTSPYTVLARHHRYWSKTLAAYWGTCARCCIVYEMSTPATL